MYELLFALPTIVYAAFLGLIVFIYIPIRTRDLFIKKPLPYSLAVSAIVIAALYWLTLDSFSLKFISIMLVAPLVLVILKLNADSAVYEQIAGRDRRLLSFMVFFSTTLLLIYMSFALLGVEDFSF